MRSLYLLLLLLHVSTVHTLLCYECWIYYYPNNTLVIEDFIEYTQIQGCPTVTCEADSDTCVSGVARGDIVPDETASRLEFYYCGTVGDDQLEFALGVADTHDASVVLCEQDTCNVPVEMTCNTCTIKYGDYCNAITTYDMSVECPSVSCAEGVGFCVTMETDICTVSKGCGEVGVVCEGDDCLACDTSSCLDDDNSPLSVLCGATDTCSSAEHTCYTCEISYTDYCVDTFDIGSACEVTTCNSGVTTCRATRADTCSVSLECGGEISDTCDNCVTCDTPNCMFDGPDNTLCSTNQCPRNENITSNGNVAVLTSSVFFVGYFWYFTFYNKN